VTRECRNCGELFIVLDWQGKVGRKPLHCSIKCKNVFALRAFRQRAKDQHSVKIAAMVAEMGEA
jgi:hypothetical protein